MKCRHCDSILTHTCLDLGTSPPSNSYLSLAQLAQPELYFPLRLLFCDQCFLVQTEDFARRELLFSDSYAYFSSYSSSWLEHAEAYVDMVCSRLSLQQGSLVIEVAANDGYLLQFLQARRIPCFGIEPTESTAQAARDKGIEIVSEFFGLELAKRLRDQGKQADLIIANNVLAHVPDINDFVAGFAILLKENGVASFEFPHLLNMVKLNQFDTAYHEHFSYLSLTAVQRIFARNGLSVFDVEQLPTHGGSLRVWAQRADTGHQTVKPELDNLLADEHRAGICTPHFYQQVQQRALNTKFALLNLLLQAKREGKRVIAYGAAAKGNTLLNFAGIKDDLVPAVIDLNPHKQGKYLPGSRIRICDINFLSEYKPDIVLVLPWNLNQEIVAQLADLFSKETRTIEVWAAIPELKRIAIFEKT